MKKFIPDGFWHTKSNGVFNSHEAICILNMNTKNVIVNFTLYFEDCDKIDDFYIEIKAERTLHVRMDKIVNKNGISVPQNKPYAIMIECDEEVAVQYTRVDTSQPEMSIATTIV